MNIKNFNNFNKIPTDSSTFDIRHKERYGWKPGQPNALDRLLDEMRTGAILHLVQNITSKYNV